MRYLLLMCLLVGCGPVWDGTFEGNIVIRYTCDDGSSGTDTIIAVWNLVEEANQLSVQTNGQCSPISGETRGNTAQLSGKQCPVNREPTYIWQTVLSSGTLTLREPSLDVTLVGYTRYGFADGTMGRCEEPGVGTLRRTR